MNDHFLKHLEKARQTVQSWPIWKQQVLGTIFRPSEEVLPCPIPEKTISMDDVMNLTCDLVDAVQKKVTLTTKEENKLFDALEAVLEEFFNCPDYTSYN